MIVGGSGFIGAKLAHYLIGKYHDHRVIIVDKSGDLQGTGLALAGVLHEKISPSDTAGFQKIFKTSKPNIVINVPDDLPDTRAQYNLVDCCEKFGVDRLVHISTGRVYGPYRRRSFETDPINPKDDHAIAALTAENIVRSTSLLKGIPTIALRLSNVYGEGDPSGPMQGMITAAIGSDFIMLPHDGKVARDWVHIDDCCMAIDQVLHSGTNHEVYNLGSGHHIADCDLAQMILSYFSLPFSMIDYDNTAFSHACETVLDIGKIKKLGWAPTLELEDRLPTVIKSYTRR